MGCSVPLTLTLTLTPRTKESKQFANILDAVWKTSKEARVDYRLLSAHPRYPILPMSSSFRRLVVLSTHPDLDPEDATS